VAFESGAVTCRMFYVPGGLPDDVIDRFAAAAAPPVLDMGREPIEGWVTSRHLMDGHITDESATVAGYLYLYLMQAERKIPPALLRAECRMRELAEMQARAWPTCAGRSAPKSRRPSSTSFNRRCPRH